MLFVHLCSKASISRLGSFFVQSMDGVFIVVSYMQGMVLVWLWRIKELVFRCNIENKVKRDVIPIAVNLLIIPIH